MRYIKFGLIILISVTLLSCGGLDEKVDGKIETVGSKLTKVPVKTEGVELSLVKGMGQITGLTVANPAGYKNDYAFQMDLVRLNLGIISLVLGGNPIVLDELVIDSPVVNFERNLQGGSNLKEISDNVKNNVGGADDKSVDEKPKADGSPKESTRIRVRKLVIEGATFNAERVDGTYVSGTLPAIELTDVGGSKGKTGAGLGSVVVIAIAREVFINEAKRKLRDIGKRVFLSLEEIDTEKILETINQELILANEQIKRIRPIVENQVQNLKNVVQKVQDEGFLEIASLSEQFEAMAGESRTQLADILTDEQLEKLKTLFNELNNTTIDKVKNAVADELMKFLELNQDQIEQLRTIFREELQKQYEFLSQFINNQDKSLETFKKDFIVHQDETLKRLSVVLDPAQIKVLKERLAELREIIQVVYFGIFES